MQQNAAVFFDIGDTLINAIDIQSKALEYIFNLVKDTNESTAIDSFKRVYYKIDKKYSGPDVNHLFAIPDQIMSDSLSAFFKLTDTQIKQLHKKYQEFVTSQIVPNHDLIKIVSDLSKKYFCGVISDGTTNEQLLTLERLELKNFFNRVIISQDVGACKPAPIIFEKAIDRLDIDRSKTVYIGDDFYKDMKGGKEFGFKTIFLRNQDKTGYIEEQEKYIDEMITRVEFRKLPELIKKMVDC